MKYFTLGACALSALLTLLLTPSCATRTETSTTPATELSAAGEPLVQSKSASALATIDWICWGGNSHCQHVGPINGPTIGNVSWARVNCGGAIQSSPILGRTSISANDTAYFARTDGRLVRTDWSTNTTLQLTYVATPPVAATNQCYSTPSFHRFTTDVEYAHPSGNLVRYNDSISAWTVEAIGGSPGWHSPHSASDSNTDVSYVQGSMTFGCFDWAGTNYDLPFLTGNYGNVNYCALETNPISGAVNWAVPYYSASGRMNIYEAYSNFYVLRAVWSPPTPDVGLQQGCLAAFDTPAIGWQGECAIPTRYNLWLLGGYIQNPHPVPDQILHTASKGPGAGQEFYSAPAVLQNGQTGQPYDFVFIKVLNGSSMKLQMHKVFWSSLDPYFFNATTADWESAAFAANDASDSAPCVDGSGIVWVNSGSMTYAFDPIGGSTAPVYTSPVIGGGGMRSSPSMGDDERVYVTTDTGYLYAFYTP